MCQNTNKSNTSFLNAMVCDDLFAVSVALRQLCATSKHELSLYLTGWNTVWRTPVREGSSQPSLPICLNNFWKHKDIKTCLAWSNQQYGPQSWTQEVVVQCCYDPLACSNISIEGTNINTTKIVSTNITIYNIYKCIYWYFQCNNKHLYK